MNFFKSKDSKKNCGFGITWGIDCKDAKPSKSDNWRLCNPKSKEDKLEAEQMILDFYSKKLASGVEEKFIIGQIARELGLTRRMTEITYKNNFLKVINADLSHKDLFDKNNRFRKSKDLSPDQQEELKKLKKAIWEEIQNLLKQHNNRVPGGVYSAVAQSLKVPESAVKCVDVEEKEKLKKSKGVKSFEELRKDVYNEVCKLQNEKEFKDNEKKILPKVAKNLGCSFGAVKNAYSAELMSEASNDLGSFCEKHYDSSFCQTVKTAEQNMAPKPPLYIWTQVILSYLKIEDNFGFSCKRVDHEKNKMKFTLSPCMFKQSNMLSYIIKHVQSHHGYKIDNFKDLTSSQIKTMKQDFIVDQEVLRRFNFLTWTFENSPKTLAHVIAVIRRSLTAEHLFPLSPDSDKQISIPVLSELTENPYPWVFSFFEPGSLDGTFKCVLRSHSKYHDLRVIFCNNGYNLYKELLRHLNSHGIDSDYGKRHQSFTIDLKDNEKQTIDLQVIPAETQKYIKRLLTPALPDLPTPSSSISNQDLDEMKALTDKLSPEVYAVLCCFKPVKTDLHCRFPHIRNQSLKFLTFDYKKNDDDVILLINKVKDHVLKGHHFTGSELANKEWISDGVNYISLKQMPLDMQQYYFELKNRRLQVQPQLQTKLAALTPELVAQLKPALPKNASRKVEMAVAMSVPHVFFQMYNSETAFANCFRVLETIEKHLFQHEQGNPIRMADIYHIFGKPSSTSAIDYLDMILYAGFETGLTRLFSHANYATVAFKDREPSENKKLYQHIADFWNNKKDVFYGKIRKSMTKTQGLFAEYAVISFLRSLPHNHNQRHGSTTPFKWLLESYDIPHEMIVKIGAALLINYHKNEKIVFHCMQPIPFDRSISKPNDARLTMTELLVDVAIPSFRLNDTNVQVDDHRSYILHLFVALFTIRARLARYHLMDSSFLAGLLAEDISSFEEAYDLIESVLLQTQWTALQCVEWAYGIWKRVFVTNVQVANAQSSKVPLYPASKKTFQISVDFVTSAALLLIHCVTARDFPGEDRIQEAAVNMLLEHPKKRADPLPQFFPVSLFSDLQKIEPLSKTRQLSDLPSIRFADWVDPVEPYQDIVQTCAFLIAGAQLRTFNFTGSLIGKSSVEPKHEFEFPVFHGSLNFVKLI